MHVFLFYSLRSFSFHGDIRAIEKYRACLFEARTAARKPYFVPSPARENKEIEIVFLPPRGMGETRTPRPPGTNSSVFRDSATAFPISAVNFPAGVGHAREKNTRPRGGPAAEAAVGRSKRAKAPRVAFRLSALTAVTLSDNV